MKLLFIAKLCVAVSAIAGVVLMAAGDVMPQLSPGQMLLGVAGLAAGLVAALVLYAAIAIPVRALLIRWGAIDTAWLWTPDYPEAFKRQRGGQAKP